MCDPIPAPRCCTQIWLTALNTWVLKEAWTIVNMSWTRTVLIFGDVFLHCPTNEVWTTGPFRAMLTETCVSPCWLTHSVVNCWIASSKRDWGTLLKNPTRSSLMAANWISSSVWENCWWICFQISGTESWPASCGQSITHIVSRKKLVCCMSSEEIHIKLKYISKIVGNQLQFDWTTLKVQVCKHLEHWSMKMVLLYNEKTAVDVPDCKMKKIWLGQNFLIGTAPRSLDKRHGQVRKCRRNLTSYSSAIWRHTTPRAVKKCVRCTRRSTPCLKTEKLKNRKTEKFANPLETGVDPTHKGLSSLVFVGHNALWISDKVKPFCTYNWDSACNELCAWQDGNEYLRIKWARLFSPLERNRRVPAEMIVLSETST